MRYKTTTGVSLNYNSAPMKLWQKAKKYGVWNPNDFDFAADKAQFDALNRDEKLAIKTLIALFVGGEEAVTLDLLPLILTIAKEGRIEEEIFLTSFLWEEAKHVDGFNRFIHEVLDDPTELKELTVPSWHTMFDEYLPDAMNALLTDPSPVNQARASVTYNMFVEGVLAETGYHSFYRNLDHYNIMPNLRAFIGKLKQDESRHIAYGIYLLSRLLAEHGEPVWEAINDQMIKLFPISHLISEESNARFETAPFGVDPMESIYFATDQFQKRMARLVQARTMSLETLDSLDLE